jgi:hypothetical protein
MNLSRRPRQCPPPKHTSVRRPEDWPPSARASARAPSVFTRPAPTTGRLANSPRAASQFSARPDGSNRAEAGWNALTWNAASHGRRPSHAVALGRRYSEPRGDPFVRLSVVLENLLPRRLTIPVFDPYSRKPSYKSCAVRLEPVVENTARGKAHAGSLLAKKV